LKAKNQILALTVICALIVLVPINLAKSQTSGTIVSVVPTQNSVRVGQTLTVNVTVSNVQNLFGLDVTVNWNTSALQILSVSDRLGVESYNGGVLHITPDYPINVAVNDTSQEKGEHHLAATSQGSATPFDGLGTITSLTFNVTSSGQSTINVVSELADHPTPDETTSELIPHTDVNCTVNAAQIPEFPQMVFLMTCALIAMATLLLVKKTFKKNPILTTPETKT
jgi:hypothetical protein